MEQELAAASSEVFALTDEQIVGLGDDSGAGHDDADVAVFRDANGGKDRAGQKLDDSLGRSKDRPLHEEQGVERAASEGGRNKGTESQPGMAVTREVPEWLAERMKDPWHGDAAKEFWDGKQRAEKEAAAYREVFATVEDARALKGIYPGGVAEAKAAAERSRELEAIDAAFYRGDAASRMALAQRMMREDPAAFREMVEAGVRLLGQVRSGQRAAASEEVASDEWGVTSEKEKTLTAETRRAVEIGREEGDQRVASGDQPDAQPRMAVPQEVVRAYGEFEKTANAELEKSVGGAIARAMEQALPNLRQATPTTQAGAQSHDGEMPLRERIAGAVREEIETALKSDRELGEQVTKILAGRRFDGAARAQVVRLIDARAQQLVPGAMKRVVGAWTQTTLATRGRAKLAAQTESVESSPRREARTDVHRQVAARNEKRSAVPTNRGRQIDYGKVSDEEILGL